MAETWKSFLDKARKLGPGEIYEAGSRDWDSRPLRAEMEAKRKLIMGKVSGTTPRRETEPSPFERLIMGSETTSAAPLSTAATATTAATASAMLEEMTKALKKERGLGTSYKGKSVMGSEFEIEEVKPAGPVLVPSAYRYTEGPMEFDYATDTVILADGRRISRREYEDLSVKPATDRGITKKDLDSLFKTAPAYRGRTTSSIGRCKRLALEIAERRPGLLNANTRRDVATQGAARYLASLGVEQVRDLLVEALLKAEFLHERATRGMVSYVNNLQELVEDMSESTYDRINAHLDGSTWGIERDTVSTAALDAMAIPETAEERLARELADDEEDHARAMREVADLVATETSAADPEFGSW